MTSEGLKYYKLGLKKKPIDHDLPKNPSTPLILKSALTKKNLLEKFNSLAPSTRRLYIYSIERAKKPETKEKRIKEVIKLLK